MMALILCFLLAAAAAFGQVTPVLISDTVRVPVNGSLFRGRVQITPPNVICGGQAYKPVPVTVQVTAGMLAVVLVPNDQCSPGGSVYQVRFQAQSGARWDEVWRVPASSSPITLARVAEVTGEARPGGLPIAGHRWASLTFTGLQDGGCADQSFAADGLTAGDPLALSLPVTLPAGVVGAAYAPGDDQATIRLCNFSGAAVTISGQPFGVRPMAAHGYISTSASLAWGPLSDGGCAEQDIVFPGAAVADVVAPGWPASWSAGVIGTMHVVASGLVKVRVCNWSGQSWTASAATHRAAIAR